jgi:hypothetical protein
MDMVRLKSFGCALLLAAVTLSMSAQQNQKDAVNNADIEAMRKANAFVPPQSPFGNFSTSKSGPDFEGLPGGTPPDNTSPQQADAWKKYMETKKDWTLMTPAEILDVPTAEKILGMPDPNDDPSLSPAERYLKRLDKQEQQEQAATLTNSMKPIRPVFQNGDGNPFEHEQVNIFRQNDGVNATNGPDARNNPNSLWNAGIFQNPTLELEARRMVQANPLWETPFVHAPQELKPDQEEKDAMQRFQAILSPPQPPETPTLTTPSSTQPVDPNMQVMPSFNPDGNTFAPLQLLGSRPTGLTPLEGPESRRLEPTPKPSWTPKLPPWMTAAQPSRNLEGPHNLPQRVY